MWKLRAIFLYFFCHSSVILLLSFSYPSTILSPSFRHPSAIFPPFFLYPYLQPIPVQVTLIPQLPPPPAAPAPAFGGEEWLLKALSSVPGGTPINAAPNTPQPTAQQTTAHLHLVPAPALFLPPFLGFPPPIFTTAVDTTACFNSKPTCSQPGRAFELTSSISAANPRLSSAYLHRPINTILWSSACSEGAILEYLYSNHNSNKLIDDARNHHDHPSVSAYRRPLTVAHRLSLPCRRRTS